MRKSTFALPSALFLLCFLSWFKADAQTIARFYTTQGEFDVELREDLVPITANNFIDLVNLEFYDQVIWHRIVPNFVIQSGDPTGTGSGGPGYTIPDEFHSSLTHNATGVLSMANAGPNTGGSQFFITLSPQPHLDSLHSIFGQVINGWTVIDAIEATPLNGNGTPVFPPVNDSIRILAPTSVQPAEGTAILGGNYPNPFSEGTVICFGLRKPASTTIRILNAEGRLIYRFPAKELPAGDHRVNWDGMDSAGHPAASGLYFYQLITPDFVDSRPMILNR